MNMKERGCVKYTNALFYCYFQTVSCHSERSEESDNVCFIFLLMFTDFSLCSTTRLHFVQNDRDRRYFDTPPLLVGLIGIISPIGLISLISPIGPMRGTPCHPCLNDFLA